MVRTSHKSIRRLQANNVSAVASGLFCRQNVAHRTRAKSCVWINGDYPSTRRQSPLPLCICTPEYLFSKCRRIGEGTRRNCSLPRLEPRRISADDATLANLSLTFASTVLTAPTVDTVLRKLREQQYPTPKPINGYERECLCEVQCGLILIIT
jgi:hypothetical protein